MMDDYPDAWFRHHFQPGDLVEVQRCSGVVFEVVGLCRDYDAVAMVEIRFVGPRRGIPPVTKGRLHKHFRIRKLTVLDKNLVQANAMLALAVAAGG